MHCIHLNLNKFNLNLNKYQKIYKLFSSFSNVQSCLNWRIFFTQEMFAQFVLLIGEINESQDIFIGCTIT